MTKKQFSSSEMKNAFALWCIILSDLIITHKRKVLCRNYKKVIKLTKLYIDNDHYDVRVVSKGKLLKLLMP